MVCEVRFGVSGDVRYRTIKGSFGGESFFGLFLFLFRVFGGKVGRSGGFRFWRGWVGGLGRVLLYLGFFFVFGIYFYKVFGFFFLKYYFKIIFRLNYR